MCLEDHRSLTLRLLSSTKLSLYDKVSATLSQDVSLIHAWPLVCEVLTCAIRSFTKEVISITSLGKMGAISERYQSASEFCVDLVCLEKPRSPQKTDVKVADGALPTDGAVEMRMALSDLARPTMRYEYTHIILVPRTFLEAKSPWKLISLSISRCVTLPDESWLFIWNLKKHTHEMACLSILPPQMSMI